MNTTMNRQKGMVLLVSLILLLMLTLIAIAASNRSTLQVRISSNSEMRNGAFLAAEAGLAQWSKAFLQNGIPLDSGKLTGGQAYDMVNLNTAQVCTGGNIEMASCFDLQATGRSGCDTGTNTNCVATAIHRQGGQRRNALSN